MPDLPVYQSHKTVAALKLAEVRLDANGALLIPEGDAHPNFRVDAAYVAKHQPQAGGYWVKYADGYESWSPAQAFDSGYTLVTPATYRERAQRMYARFRDHSDLDVPAWDALTPLARAAWIEAAKAAL